MITIVDYGMGNLGSVLNMLKHLGYYKASIASDLKKIAKHNQTKFPKFPDWIALSNPIPIKMEHSSFISIIESGHLKTKSKYRAR